MTLKKKKVKVKYEAAADTVLTNDPWYVVRTQPGGRWFAVSSHQNHRDAVTEACIKNEDTDHLCVAIHITQIAELVPMEATEV